MGLSLKAEICGLDALRSDHSPGCSACCAASCRDANLITSHETTGPKLPDHQVSRGSRGNHMSALVDSSSWIVHQRFDTEFDDYFMLAERLLSENLIVPVLVDHPTARFSSFSIVEYNGPDSCR